MVDGIANRQHLSHGSRFKLLMDVGSPDLQLYNVVEDDGESNDLAKSNPVKADELKQRLMEWYLDYPHRVDRSLYQGWE